MLIEMHAHTSRHSSCSEVDAVDVVRQTMKKSVQGLVITEHHYLWSDEEIARLRQEAEIDEYFVLLAAQEVDTDNGHMLVYGAGETIEERMTVVELRERYPAAALVLAHPFRNRKIPTQSRLISPLFDAIEIFSSNHSQLENYLGLKLWHQYRFTAISGSDTHALETAGILPTQFDHPVRSMDELVDELKKGRCRPFYKEIPKAGANLTVYEITMGTKGEDESRSRLILKTPNRPENWKSIRNTSVITQHVHDHGFSNGSFRVPKTLEIDNDKMLVIEEGQRGKRLFELMLQVSPPTGREYFFLAAKWLARLHSQKIRIGSPDATIRRENRRFKSYLKSFESTYSPYLVQVRELLDAVRTFEDMLFSHAQGNFVQVHGDYHPKNIIIGQDRMQDIATLFISVIDFGNSQVFDPAFDLGYFISQFINQFRAFPHVLNQYRPESFVHTYIEEAALDGNEEFTRSVNLFRIRANLSIASFLVKVGKGRSRDMDMLIADSMDLLGTVTAVG
ncbi:MAG: phosphotransferase [Desulfomonilia bacterium]